MRDIGTASLQATFLQGNVSRADVIREVRTSRYDVLLAMTHGYAQGIQLGPGAWLEPQHLGALSRSGVALIVLLACDSLVAGQAILTSSQADVICHVAELDSEDAYLVGSLLVQGFADGLTFREAYERARPTNDSEFVFLAAPRPAGQLFSMPTTIDDFERRLVEHARQLTDHAKQLHLHERSIAQHAEHITALQRDGTFQVRLRKMDVFLWATLAGGVGILIFVLMGQFR